MDICHTHGKKIGVWVDRSVTSESEEFYRLLFRMKVDFFCTDYPNQFLEARNRYENEKNSYVDAKDIEEE